jgi:FG-GAP repeat
MSTRLRIFLGVALGALLLTWLLPSQAVHAFNAVADRHCDFNGDGSDDQALGARHEDLETLFGTIADAGGVNVIYGSEDGPTDVGNEFWTQATPGVEDVAEAGDGFGAALACGNFNGDAFDDLVIGVPGENLLGISDAGVVHVLVGSEGGLTTPPEKELWHQNITDIGGRAELADTFGSAVTAGDFNGDGFDDLAVGVPGEEQDLDKPNSGLVNVIRGSSAGLTAAGDVFRSQDSQGIEDAAESEDMFGSVLAAGAFDGGNLDDLAVGIPGEDANRFGHTIQDSGAVQVLRGSSPLLSSQADQFLTQTTSGLMAQPFDQFGFALAAGDFGGSVIDDLAIGMPGRIVGASTNQGAGAVTVLRGTLSLLAGLGTGQLWSQARVRENPARLDRFGAALSAGDFDDDGFDDVAVGVLGEDVGSTPITNAGGVNVIRGSSAFLTATGNQFWSQNSLNIEDISEPHDLLGRSIAVGDLDQDGIDDLIIAAPFENIGAIADACLVNNIMGTDTAGLTAAGDSIWHQNKLTIRDQAEPFDCNTVFD